MSDIVVFGAGRIAEVASVYLQHHSPHRIVGYCVDGAFRRDDQFMGRPLVDWELLEARFPPTQVQLLGPLSYRRLNAFRRDRYLEGKARGYSFASFVHPNSQVYPEVGENCFILEQNVVQPFVELGNNVILWSGNHIGHHATVGDHCFFSSHVGITSGVRIGQGCFFGGKSAVAADLTIGDWCYLGPASAVEEDVPDHGVYLNRSAKRSRHHSSRIARIL